MYMYMKEWMAGWLDGWMAGWLDGWMDGWMKEYCMWDPRIPDTYVGT